MQPPVLQGQVLALSSSSGRVDDPKNWSFTPLRLLEKLKPKFRTCLTLNYALEGWADFYRRATIRYLGGWNCSRSAYLNGLFERRFCREWASLPEKPDVCLHISDLCIPPPAASDCRHFVYTDATLVRLAPHYPKPVSPWVLKHYRRLTRQYLESTRAVFTMNEWSRQSYVEDHGFPPERVFNVGFGINMAPFEGEKDWDANLILIVLRRGTEEVKGLHLLLAALAKVRREIPKTELAVVGTSLPSPMDGVTFYENFPREKTIELMRSATLYAMPARCEVNGIAYLEALASKTPILGLNRFAFPEFSGGGKFGFVVNEPTPDAVAEQIISALKSKVALRRMGEEGQRYATERFRWDAVTERMCSVFESVP